MKGPPWTEPLLKFVTFREEWMRNNFQTLSRGML